MADSDKTGPSELTESDLENVRGGAGSTDMLATTTAMANSSGTSVELPPNSSTAGSSVADLLGLQSQFQMWSVQTEITSDLIKSAFDGLTSPIKGP